MPLAEESAREITEIFRETVEKNLAGKKDLKTTESNLIKYIESTRNELKKDIAESKADTIKWVAGCPSCAHSHPRETTLSYFVPVFSHAKAWSLRS